MRIYLDNNATAPLRPEARAAMLAALETPGNASSVHGEGRAARHALEAARRNVAALVKADPDNVVFTSGGTEANALAMHGAIQAAADAGQRFTRLVVSAIEHDSVLATARRCEQVYPGLRLAICPVDRAGRISLDDLKQMLMEGKGRALISMMAVNNETGVVQPIADIARLAHAHNSLLHCDAVQAAGKIPLSMDVMSADYLTLSAHKIGGPQGAGAVVRAKGVPMQSQLTGGQQEFGFRPGTQNVAAIAGFGAAANAVRDIRQDAARRDRFEQRLKSLCPDAVIFGEDAERVPNTTCIAVANIPAETVLIALDLDGFAVSAGAACSSGKVVSSHVLSAMGYDTSLSSAAIRISSGWQTREQELDAFADAWARIINRARARTAA
jgi:cysteine desulfurase